MNILINFVAFQIGWFAAVLGGANGLAWAGTLVALAMVALHLARVPNPRNEVILIGIAGSIGAVWDSTLVQLGVTSYPSGGIIPGLAPHWIVAMWMLFATTLNVSMRWLRGRWWLAAVSGGVFGPMAFYAGERMGGVAFPDFWNAMIILALGWAVFMPVLSLLSARFDGTTANDVSPALSTAPRPLTFDSRS
jgi:hypothetical protein